MKSNHSQDLQDLTAFLLAVRFGASDDMSVLREAFDRLSETSQLFLLNRGWVVRDKHFQEFVCPQPALHVAAATVFSEACSQALITLALGNGLDETMKATLKLG